MAINFQGASLLSQVYWFVTEQMSISFFKGIGIGFGTVFKNKCYGVILKIIKILNKLVTRFTDFKIQSCSSPETEEVTIAL